MNYYRYLLNRSDVCSQYGCLWRIHLKIFALIGTRVVVCKLAYAKQCSLSVRDGVCSVPSDSSIFPYLLSYLQDNFI